LKTEKQVDIEKEKKNI